MTRTFVLAAAALALTATTALAGDVVTRTVTFQHEGETLVGTLHLPANRAADAKLPAVVVTGSWTTVKEQMAGTYAREMAERGYAALAFDFRNFGQSGGAVRAFEDPQSKISDIAAAARFLASLPEVDANRVGGVGVCASAGYMAAAINQGAPLASFVNIAGWFHDAASVGLIYGGAEGVERLVKLGSAAKARFEATGAVEYVAAFSYTDPTAAMVGPFDYYGKAERGAIPQWDNRFAVMTWPAWLGFDGVKEGKAVNVPTMSIAGEGTALNPNVRAIHEAIKAPKELVWSEGLHFDFYDDRATVERSADAASRFLARHLGGARS